MEYNLFSANSSISPIGLKPLDVAKGRGNRVGLGGERGWTRRNRVGLGGNWVRRFREHGRMGGTGSDWGSDWEVGLGGLD